MLGYLVDALTAALPVALVWAVLRDGPARGDSAGRRAFLAASGVGAALALGTAAVRMTTNWIAWEPSLLVLLPVVIVLGLAGLAAPRLGAWGRFVFAAFAGAVLFLGLPPVFMTTRGMAPPGVSVLTSETVLNLSGYLLGLALAATTAGALVGAWRGAGLRVRRVAVALAVAVYLAGQLTALVRISLARRLIDVSPTVFAAVVWLVNHEAVFVVALFAVSALPVASALRRARVGGEAPANPAEARLRRAAIRSRRRFLAVAASGVALSALTMTAGRRLAEAEPELSPPEQYDGDDRQVWLSLETLDDGHLHRYAYPAAHGVEVRFFAIRKAPGAFVAVLDACEICGPAGYLERGGMVVCKMCDVAMNIATIGFKGGCNPIPIDYQTAGGRLTIERSMLESSAKVFA
ncbi:MAG: DUF2318 domain-containing protein [Arachnia sp.]